MMIVLEDALIYVRGLKMLCAGLYTNAPEGTVYKLDAGAAWVQANDVLNWLDMKVHSFRKPQQEPAAAPLPDADVIIH